VEKVALRCSCYLESVRAVMSVRGGEAEGSGRRRKAAGSKQKTRTPHSDVGNSINATGR